MFYQMKINDKDFLEQIEKIEIIPIEGFKINAQIPVWVKKEGRKYEIYDNNTGLRITSYKGAKKNLEKYAIEQIDKYIELISKHKELIVRINRTYKEALKKYLDKHPQEKTWNPLEELAKYGSQTQDSKQRILDAMITLGNYNDMVAFVKKEYGIGGFGIPRTNREIYHMSSGDWNSARIMIGWYEPNGDEEIRKMYTWRMLTDKILDLIMEGRYI